MARIAVTVAAEEIEAIRADLLEAANEQTTFRGKLRAVTQAIAGAARVLAPYDTGTLSSSIHGVVESEGNDVVGIVGSRVVYAPYQEFGTQKMAAQPYLWPAWEQMQHTADEAMLHTLDNKVRIIVGQ